MSAQLLMRYNTGNVLDTTMYGTEKKKKQFVLLKVLSVVSVTVRITMTSAAFSSFRIGLKI